MESNAPEWARILSREDWAFVKRLLLASGSLKEVAAGYGISYPTVRARLDVLIEKVKSVDEANPVDAFTLLVQSLVIEGRLEKEAARALLKAHQHNNKKSL